MSLSPPVLLADLVVHEILLRFPADEPACLTRAFLVCKAWRRVLDDPGFRRRFSEFHWAPPMLGFLYNDCSTASPATPASPPPRLSPRSTPCAPTVLCAVDGCDHVDCHGSPFLVAFIGTDDNGLMSACVYTSEAGAWSYITSFQHPYAWITSRPSVLLGNTVDFPCAMGAGIMEYDVAVQKLSWIDVPIEYLDKDRNFIIMTAEDGVLGFAGVQDSCMYLWSRLIDANGAVAWAQPRVIKLDKLLPARVLLYEPCVVCFVEGAGVIFLYMF